MDPNWIMAIIAISAIISPAIVSIIDNIFKYKTKQLELHFPNKQKTLNEFVEKAMHYYPSGTYKNTEDYISAKNNLFIFFDIPSDDLFNQLEHAKDTIDLNKYKETINKIVKQLSLQLKK